MKQKQHNIFIICFSITVIIIAMVYIYYSHSLSRDMVQKKNFSPIPDIQAPTNRDMLVVKKLNNKLPGIAYPVMTDTPPVNMQIFGRRKFSTSRNNTSNKQTAVKITDPGYLVTFALKSGNKGICTINNKMYKVGDALPDGSIVKKVESHRVAIYKNDKNKWLYVVNK